MNRLFSMVLMVLALFLSAGCVERKMVIRSDPPGAPAWVDEEPAGATPLEYPFHHYGHRKVRVGPIRDENDAVAYREKEEVLHVRAPWFQTFPIDFFFEVLWPGKLVDEHVVTITLQPASEEEGLYGEQRAEEVLERAEQFRDEALRAPIRSSP